MAAPQHIHLGSSSSDEELSSESEDTQHADKSTQPQVCASCMIEGSVLTPQPGRYLVLCSMFPASESCRLHLSTGQALHAWKRCHLLIRLEDATYTCHLSGHYGLLESYTDTWY
jgi:hypothetical protein